jgi:hypothetical protein
MRMFNKMKLKQRMYLQFSLAVLPLVLMLLFQSLSVSDLPVRVSRVLDNYHLALQASASYKNFLNGVADAKTAALLNVSPAPVVKEAAKTLAIIQAAIAEKSQSRRLCPSGQRSTTLTARSQLLPMTLKSSCPE